MRTIASALLAVLAGFAPLCAQTADGKPAFDVASVKPVAPGQQVVRAGGPGTADPGRFIDSDASLLSLLATAYGVGRDQISGPDWLRTQEYDIAATMPAETTSEQFHLMLRNLLAERFWLILHHQVKEVPVYTLEVASGGPKMKRWSSADAQATFPLVNRAMEMAIPRGLTLDEKGFPMLPAQYTFGYAWTGAPFWLMRAACRGCTMSEFVKKMGERFTMRQWLDPELTPTSQLPLVVDKTGLSGKFNFNLEFAELVPSKFAVVPGSGQPFNIAIEKQLGLKLEKGKKAPVDTLVIDHAEKLPTEN